MSLISFKDLMAEAERGRYAVGYFESWNFESLLAAADAAEALRSPVILGFSGINLPDPARAVREPLSAYAALGCEVCRRLSVSACLLFNESADFAWVCEAIDLGFGLVMFTDDNLSLSEQTARVRGVVERAHRASVAVEGELSSPPGVDGGLVGTPTELNLTDPKAACEFVKATGVDALAVNIGQAHLHGRRQLPLDLDRLAELRKALSIPLVLHGASSIRPEDLSAAVRLGIRKINVGSVLKRSYFEGLRTACAKVGAEYNPYDVLGSGLAADVMTGARRAMQREVESLMRLFGSAGRAK